MLPGALSLNSMCVFEEYNVSNFNKCIFRKYGTPVCRTKRRRFQKLHFHNLWGSCAQHKTSESSKMHFQKLWDPCAQNETSEISTNALPEPMGLLCAEQNVGNIKHRTFRNSWTPVRRTKLRKSQTVVFQEFWDSYARAKPRESKK